MSLLGRFEVTPYNAQVELSDPDADDYPQWLTGNEAVVSLQNSVAVATQGDDSGTVLVEVWYGEVESEDNSWSGPILDQEFVTEDASVLVGNTVGNEFHSVVVPVGRHRLRVFTSPAGRLVSRVRFLLSRLCPDR